MNLNLHAIARLVVVCKEHESECAPVPFCKAHDRTARSCTHEVDGATHACVADSFTYVARRSVSAAVVHAWQISGAYAVHDLPTEVRDAAALYQRSLSMASSWKFFALRYDMMKGTEDWPVLIIDRALAEYAAAICGHVNGLSLATADTEPPTDPIEAEAAIDYRELHAEPVVTVSGVGEAAP